MLPFSTVLCNLCIRNKVDGFLVDFDVNVVSSVALIANPDPRVGVCCEYLTIENLGHHFGEGRVFQKES